MKFVWREKGLSLDYLILLLRAFTDLRHNQGEWEKISGGVIKCSWSMRCAVVRVLVAPGTMRTSTNRSQIPHSETSPNTAHHRADMQQNKLPQLKHHSVPTCLRAYVPTCLRAYVPTCLRAYVPTCLRAYVPTCLRAYVPTCLRAYVPTCLRAYVPTCLRAYVPTCLRAYVPTCLRAYVPTCLRAYVPTCLRAYVPTCLHRNTVYQLGGSKTQVTGHCSTNIGTTLTPS